MNRFLSLFSGRMNRLEFFAYFFLFFVVFCLFVFLVFCFSDYLSFHYIQSLIILLLYTLLGFFLLSIVIKRLRDMGFSVLWSTPVGFYFLPIYLFLELPFSGNARNISFCLFLGVAPAFLLFCLAWPSKKQENDSFSSLNNKELLK